MNEHDQGNLQFLLHSAPEVIHDWYKQADEDDLAYAMELLNAYSKELDARATVLLMEATDDVDDVGVARELLARFR